MLVSIRSRCLPAVLIVAACLGKPVGAPAAEPAESPEQRRQEIERLIEQLASENPKPKNIEDSDRERVTVFPPGYSRDKQKKVYQAADDLRKFGIDAFPQLIDHFDDRRYSYSERAMNARSDSLFYQESVGAHCRKILEGILYIYESWGEPGSFGPTYFGYPELQSKTTAQRWWAKNKDKPLWRLQADILQWAIDLELRTKQDDKYNAAVRSKRAVEANRKKLDKLLATKKPM
jgi:hypothetical protein